MISYCQRIIIIKIYGIRWTGKSTKLQKFVRDSLMVRMGACRVPDRGSIPRRGDFFIRPGGCCLIITK